MDYVAGIDLGTTNTVCAVYLQGKSSPEVIPLTMQFNSFDISGRTRAMLMPSAVCLKDGKVYVGHIGRLGKQMGFGDYNFVSIKRYMGTHWVKTVKDEVWTPERVSACILATVKKELETKFGTLPSKLVITVPASFSTEGRRATLTAASIAGFDLSRVSLFDEPTAALLNVLIEQQNGTLNQEPTTHMIVDIGGGTQDVSMIEMEVVDGQYYFDIIGQSRLNELAGDDFDFNIAGLLLYYWESTFKCKFEDFYIDGPDERLHKRKQKQFIGNLLLEANKLKKSLSEKMEKTRRRDWGGLREKVELSSTPKGPWTYDFSVSDLTVSLKEYFEYTSDEDERKHEYGFFRAIEQCIDSAEQITDRKIEPYDIDHVWLAGGSAQLPLIKYAVQKITNHQPKLVNDCMYAIAKGAAQYAHIKQYGQINLTERLFDGVFLQTSTDSFLCLVSPFDKIPVQKKYPNILISSTPGMELSIHLFYGPSTDAVQGQLLKTKSNLRPLVRKTIKFDEIFPIGQKISVEVSINENKNVHLEFSTVINNQVHEGIVHLNLGSRESVSEVGAGVILPPVNV